jgi:hypothetical protein
MIEGANGKNQRKKSKCRQSAKNESGETLIHKGQWMAEKIEKQGNIFIR